MSRKINGIAWMITLLVAFSTAYAGEPAAEETNASGPTIDITKQPWLASSGDCQSNNYHVGTACSSGVVGMAILASQTCCSGYYSQHVGNGCYAFYCN
jgi:hypothetical protein